MPAIPDLSKGDSGNDVALIPDTASRSRGAIRASFAINVPPFRKQRAQGTPGARCARSLACECEVSTRRSHHRSTGFTRHSPRNGFNGFLRALPGVRILGCHRHRRIKVCQSPVGLTRLRQFSTSNGCQDHTTSPSASAPFVSTPEFAHGVDPALQIPCAPDAAASTASRPASVTIANRPSVGRDGGGYIADLGQPRTEIFLQMGLDRQIGDLPVGRASPASSGKSADANVTPRRLQIPRRRSRPQGECEADGRR
jgi:hypothetical protein